MKVFGEIASTLAARCCRNGILQSERLDDHQIHCYDLALTASDLLAAREIIALTANRTTSVMARLASVYLADAFPRVLDRLEAISDDLEFPAELAAIRHSPDFVAIVQAGRGGRLAETGRLLLETGDAFTQIDSGEHADMLRDLFHRFGQEVVAPLAEEIHRHDLTIPESLLGRMREMGVFGLSVPARFGGSAPDEGEDNLAMIAVTEALSEASLGAAGSLITRPEILTRAILTGGTEIQKAYWLPRIAAGEPLAAIAITEPDFGSDAANLKLKATRCDGGWRLDGAKTWCTFAGKAGVLMVVARTGVEQGYKGLSILLVEKPSYDGHDFHFQQAGAGRLSGRAIATIGYRGMHSYDLSFEDFFVPEANVLGGDAGLGRGFYYTMAGMTGGRIQTAGRACGLMAAAIKAALRYAKDRKVFGMPLADNQLMRAKLALMAARYVACRHLAYHVGRMLNRGQGQMEASLVKLFACRAAEIVTRDALQAHGGMGYAEEMPVSRYFLDARVLSIFEGAEETLALKVIARGLLQRSLDGQPTF